MRKIGPKLPPKRVLKCALVLTNGIKNDSFYADIDAKKELQAMLTRTSQNGTCGAVQIALAGFTGLKKAFLVIRMAADLDQLKISRAAYDVVNKQIEKNEGGPDVLKFLTLGREWAEARWPELLPEERTKLVAGGKTKGGDQNCQTGATAT